MFVNKIQILPENIVNKIAAGEIVERPAAVAKEIVENSIDAGAKNIKATFTKGGKYSIIVEDDGCGMTPAEAAIAIKPHATSKLRNIDDLNSLMTFGFRGEALPSISSVSKFKLLTGTKTTPTSHEITIYGGKIISERQMPKFAGTKITIENLFFNVPARRKFLKSETTEALHIISLIKNLALAEMGINFTLIQNGEKIFESPANGACGDRVNKIFNFNEKFINFSYEEENISLNGAICDPNFGEICKKNITIFVNKRLIKSDLIGSILVEELREYFPNHRGILAYLFFKIDPKFLDINVHPMKKEVRFKNVLTLHNFLQNFVKKIFAAPIDFRKIDDKTTTIEQTEILRNTSIAKFQSKALPTKVFVEKNFNFTKTASRSVKMASAPKPLKIIEQNDIFAKKIPETLATNWRFIGKLNDEIALFESATGLIIFNIKLALNRLIYENFLQKEENFEPQKILIPIEISLKSFDEASSKNFLTLLKSYGFSVYAFGKHDYKIDAIPSWLSYKSAEIIIKNFENECFDSNQTLSLEKMRVSFARNALSSLNFAVYQDSKALEELYNALFKCRNSAICPQGKAIFFEISFTDLNRRF